MSFSPRMLLPLLFISCSSESGIGDQLLPDAIPNPRELEDPTKTDRIVQTTTPLVDVLWMIDTSCSMSCVVGCHGLISDKVVENFPKFTDYFAGSGLDFHIGVINADMEAADGAGRLRMGGGQKWIDVTTADPTNSFFEMTRPGTDGSGSERGLATTWSAVEVQAQTWNGGFYREDASLHTIVLSNENDQTAPGFITRPEFVDWYDGLKPENDDRTFSSIVCLTRNAEACRDAVGTTYIQTTADIGGILWDITSEDWAGLLDQLGAQAAGLKREYFLSERPVAGTIEVEVVSNIGARSVFEEAIGEPPVGDWTYNVGRNSITFLEFTPEPLSQILITYDIASSEF